MSPVSMLSDSENEATVRAAPDAANQDLDAVLGELAHAVANSLNTIAAASELAELLIARSELAGAAKSLTRIESECMRAARLLREGRKFMTFEIDPARDSIDLVALLRACAGSEEGRVDIHADRGLPKLRCDAAALRRMCTEILHNAFQSGASLVRVEVGKDTTAPEVRIDFRDDGPGIDAPVARLFLPFFSTRSDEHNGLGLAYAARIATAHGGSIGVDDAAAGGAFWIKLPIGSD